MWAARLAPACEPRACALLRPFVPCLLPPFAADSCRPGSGGSLCTLSGQPHESGCLGSAWTLSFTFLQAGLRAPQASALGPGAAQPAALAPLLLRVFPTGVAPQLLSCTVPSFLACSPVRRARGVVAHAHSRGGEPQPLLAWHSPRLLPQLPWPGPGWFASSCG